MAYTAFQMPKPCRKGKYYKKPMNRLRRQAERRYLDIHDPQPDRLLSRPRYWNYG